MGKKIRGRPGPLTVDPLMLIILPSVGGPAGCADLTVGALKAKSELRKQHTGQVLSRNNKYENIPSKVLVQQAPDSIMFGA